MSLHYHKEDRVQHDNLRRHEERYPHVSMEKVDCHSPPETCQLLQQAGVAKAHLPWADLIVKSFFGGIFISLGSAFDLVIAGGAPGLRASNPSLATMLAGFVFPIGFVLIVLTNVELVTSNMAVMMYSTLAQDNSLRLATKLGDKLRLQFRGMPVLCWHLGLVD